MNNLLITALISPLLAGCSSLARPALDAAGAAGGAGLGYTISNGNILATAGGAAGGALLSEGAQALISSKNQRSYKAGYQKGQSDAVKTWYHQLQDKQRPPASR